MLCLHTTCIFYADSQTLIIHLHCEVKRKVREMRGSNLILYTGHAAIRAGLISRLMMIGGLPYTVESAENRTRYINHQKQRSGAPEDMPNSMNAASVT